MTLARGFHLERFSGGVCRAVELHEQRVVETLRRHIFDRDRPVKPVQSAVKVASDVFVAFHRGAFLTETLAGDFLNLSRPRHAGPANSTIFAKRGGAAP